VRNYHKAGCADFSALSATQRLAEARRLLIAAGYSPARPLQMRLRHPNSDTHRRIALAVVAMWQPLGVRAELVSADLRAHQAALAQGDFDVARGAWYAEDTDPVSFLRLLDSRAGAMNLSRFADAAYDALLDRSDRTVDVAQRAGLLREAEARAMELQPIAPLYVYVSRRLVSPSVEGWTDNPRGVHVNRWLGVRARTR
jgi:oligopeptide transport system substrate-binding protein